MKQAQCQVLFVTLTTGDHTVLVGQAVTSNWRLYYNKHGYWSLMKSVWSNGRGGGGHYH